MLHKEKTRRKFSCATNYWGGVDYEYRKFAWEPFTEEHIRRLDEISAIKLGFPHDFLAQPHIKKLVYAGKLNEIDNYRA